MKFKVPSLNLSMRERLLSGAVILSLMVAFYKFWFSKQVVEIDRLKSEAITIEKSMQIEKRVLQDLHAASVRAIQNKKQDQRYIKYLEASRYLSTLIEKLGAEPDTKGIELLKMNVADRKTVNEFQKNTFQIEIESSFVALGKFLGTIDASKLLLEVKSVRLSRIDQELKRCKAVVEVDGYYKPEEG